MLASLFKGPIGMAALGLLMAAGTATAGVVAGPTAAQAVSDRIHATAVPTPTPKPTAKPLPTNTPVPTRVTGTKTPTPRATRQPTAAAQPQQAAPAAQP